MNVVSIWVLLSMVKRGWKNICRDLVDRARKVTEGFTDDEQDQIFILKLLLVMRKIRSTP